MENPFKGLYALSDAAQLWGKADSTLRHAIKRGKFKEGVDVKLFGKQWVITEDSLIREYGEQEKVLNDNGKS